MSYDAIVLFTLATTSALFAAALAVAWRRFGRERHAALWSLAYAFSSGTWAANTVEKVLLPANPWLMFAILACMIACFTLIALGFRHRAGSVSHGPLIAVGGGVMMAWEGGLLLMGGHAGIERSLLAAYCAAMLVVAARTLAADDPDSGRARGGPAFWMLIAFASYLALLSGVAMGIPRLGGGPYQFAYRMLLMLGLPSGLFGTGLFAMLLLAGDLAETLRRLAGHDPLTAILNRRGFEQAATPLLSGYRRQRRPLALVIADLDHFKMVNDRHGHDVGDAVLKRFVQHAGAALRDADLFGRFGGEEFVFLLPDTSIRGGVEAMQRMREGLAEAVRDLVPTGITVSFGIAAIERGEQLDALMQRADQALYRSKMDGRDRITVAPPPGANQDARRAA